MNATRTSEHICESLIEIEDALSRRARVWARVDGGDGERVFIVTCGDDPGTEPDGPCILIGVTRVYCDDHLAARLLGYVVGESVDENN